MNEMSKLIAVNYEAEEPTVSAQDLTIGFQECVNMALKSLKTFTQKRVKL